MGPFSKFTLALCPICLETFSHETSHEIRQVDAIECDFLDRYCCDIIQKGNSLKETRNKKWMEGELEYKVNEDEEIVDAEEYVMEELDETEMPGYEDEEVELEEDDDEDIVDFKNEDVEEEEEEEDGCFGEDEAEEDSQSEEEEDSKVFEDDV